MRALALGPVLVALLASTARGQDSLPPALARLRFLLGTWEAVGSGSPGQGAGRATFAVALGGRIITRTSFAEYPAAGERPASRHDDLMVIYTAGDTTKADYYDSEGHVIRYVVTEAGDGRAVFLSAAAAGVPRYRLTYAPTPDGGQNGRFEVAAPGAPEMFRTYLAWTSRRVPGP